MFLNTYRFLFLTIRGVLAFNLSTSPPQQTYREGHGEIRVVIRKKIRRERRLPFMLSEECDQVVEDVSPLPPPHPTANICKLCVFRGQPDHFPVCFWHNNITSNLDSSWQLLLINTLMLLTKYQKYTDKFQQTSFCVLV